MTQANRNSVYNPNADLHGLVKVGSLRAGIVAAKRFWLRAKGRDADRLPDRARGWIAISRFFVLAARTMPWPIVGQSIQGHTL